MFAGAFSVFRFFLVFFWVRCLGSFVGCLLGVISVFRFCLGVFLLGFCSGFFGSALALLCILPVYVGAPYAFFSIKFYLLIKKKDKNC